MFVDQLKVPSEARLNQILHTLAHVHDFVLDNFESDSLIRIQEQYEAEKSAIVESAAFNSYHANPAYVKASLITEAVRLLFEIAPKRRKKPVAESIHKDPSMTQLSEKKTHRKPDFLDVDGDGNTEELWIDAEKDKKRAQPHKLKEKWDTEMKTKPSDKGKWDGWSIAELKARKKKLMSKEDRTAAETKEVRQINFAIRAKQENSWGKIKESALMEDQNLDQAETLLAAKDLSDQLQNMAENAAKMAVDKLMPLVDTMKSQFGQPAAEGFNTVVKDNLQKVLDTIIAAKDQTDNAILTLQGGGTPSAADDISAELPGEAMPSGDQEGEAPSEIDFEKEFDAMPSTSGPEQEPLGRAKKSELAEADKEEHDVHAMAKTGKDARGRPLNAQQKQAAKRAADELSKANLEEKLTKSMTAGEIISDFVDSDDPRFKGKSKTERTKMALGAYYGMHPEKKRKFKEELENGQNISELDMVIETLKAEFHALKNQFQSHQHSYQQLVSEGKAADPLGIGYGLEGAAVLQNIKKVRSRINEAVAEKQESLAKLNEAAQFKNNINNKISKLNEQLQTLPYGVVGINQQGRQVKKFFENREHLQMWLDFNSKLLKEHTVIEPGTIKQLQQKLKKFS